MNVNSQGDVFLLSLNATQGKDNTEVIMNASSSHDGQPKIQIYSLSFPLCFN